MINGEVFREKNNPWMSRFWKVIAKAIDRVGRRGFLKKIQPLPRLEPTEILSVT